jgi:hypothetical protein
VVFAVGLVWGLGGGVGPADVKEKKQAVEPYKL